ncbi:hypothetical protein [Flexivirga meconopsidis]|uniref:hypothetical protein n=1 Tax=Flexivirga meconopsidis TaxID=2977121 RepID=UPI0022402B84|nr:hypothetical protein [Flexivirga meconopsidis]
MSDPIQLLLDDLVPRATAGYTVGALPAPIEQALRERCSEVVELPTLDSDAQVSPRGVIAVGDVAPGAGQSAAQAWARAVTDAAGLLETGGVLLVFAPAHSVFSGLVDGFRATGGSDLRQSTRRFTERLTALGLDPAVHLMYGDPAAPRAVLRADIAARAGAGSLATVLLAEALSAPGADDDTSPLPLLSPEEAIDHAARAGALPEIAGGLIAAVGGRGRAVYAVTSDAQPVWADPADDGAVWVTSYGSVPRATTFEHTLRRLLERGDLPGFRTEAARIGTWLRTHPDAAGLDRVAFDRLLDVDGAALTPVTTTATSPDPASADREDDTVLTGAWHRFHSRLGPLRFDLPWPQLTTDDALITSWLEMSGVAGARSATLPHPAPTSVERAVDAIDRAVDRNALLEQRIAALTEVLEHRDSQLMVREASIYRLHTQLLDAIEKAQAAERDTAQVRGRSSYKLARRLELLTQPKQFVRAAGNKLEKQVRTIRRMR